MQIKTVYEDKNVLVIDKPAGITVFPEEPSDVKTLVDYIIETFPYLKDVGSSPRYGIVHRIDKDTSGILIVAKNNKEFEFLQKQFKERKIEKKYIALAVGEIKSSNGEIETLIGRSPKDRRKQKVFLPNDPKAQGKRTALTKYTVLKRFKGYTLCEVSIKTGRKHQIRVHFSYIGHPLAGDKLYGFKGQLKLKRQFLHASYIKIHSIDNKEIEVSIELPEDLKEIIKNIKEYDN